MITMFMSSDYKYCVFKGPNLKFSFDKLWIILVKVLIITLNTVLGWNFLSHTSRNLKFYNRYSLEKLNKLFMSFNVFIKYKRELVLL